MRALRMAAIAGVTAAALALSGCSLLLIPPPGASDPVPASLSFADGDGLAAPAWRLDWTARMADLDDYRPTEPYHRGGDAWEQDDSGCVVTQWRSMLTDVDRHRADRALSDRLLGIEFDMTGDEVAEYAEDDTIEFGSSGSIDVRTIWGEDDDASWVVVARGVARLGTGLMAAVDCPAGEDALAVYDALRVDGWRIVATRVGDAPPVVREAPDDGST